MRTKPVIRIDLASPVPAYRQIANALRPLLVAGVFVEKRSGLGYILNLGNPLSWLVVLVGIVALSIPLFLVP